MKHGYKDLDKDGGGSITLTPEDPEDMWHAYNLVSEGDGLKASTLRKVQTESSTGSVGSSRIRTVLMIQVESVDFDYQACVLRVKGRNISENQFVKMGAYHTLDLEANRKFTLTKQHWDKLACDPSQHADVAAVVMHEGLANVCLVTASMTLVRAKIDVLIPRKRKGHCGNHEKGLQKFYDTILQAILRHVNFDVVKCVLLGSPGFVKDQCFEYIMQQAVKMDNKVLIENKGKFMLVHSSNGFKSALKELLADPAVAVKLADTKATGEVKALNMFYSMLQNEPSKAFYGIKHVEKANEAQAIEVLLISDTLFRAKDFNTRRRYVDLVDSVKDSGGEVKIFSSLHISGEQLEQLTGVAAILRYPMPELEEEASSSDED